MGMLDRYRKAGGFFQLLNLIETSPEAKQEKFLGLIKEESVAWEAEIRRRKLTFDRIATWQQSDLMEVCPRIPDKIIAVALFPLAPEKREGFIKSLSHAQKRVVEEFLSGTAPASGEVFSCQSKIVQEVRTMGQGGQLKFDKIDPELVIPEGIEEKLNNSFGPLSGTKETTTVAMANKTASASAGGGGGSTGAGAAMMNGPAGAMPSGAVMEELVELRRRLQHVQARAEELEKENSTLKSKLDQIRKIA